MEVFSALLSLFATHLCKLDTQLAANCQSTFMSSVTPHRSDNDGPQPRLVISTHDTCIWKLEYLPDGRRVVTGSGDKTVRVWNLENGEQEGTSMEHESGIRNLAITQDGTKSISSDEGGEIKVWDIESHELVKEWTHPECFPEIAISPDDRLIAVGSHAVTIYTMAGGRVNHSIEVGKAIWSMCFSPDGTKLAWGTDGDIRVYDVGDGTLELVLGPLKSHQDSSRDGDVLWSRDGSRLSRANNTIRCWNSDTGAQIGHPWTGHTNYIRSLTLSPDGSTLASASFDSTIRFWDTSTGNPIRQHLQHDKPVNAVRFSPSGEFVASLRWDGEIYLWRVPWLDSVAEHCVRMLIRYTSALVLIALTI